MRMQVCKPEVGILVLAVGTLACKPVEGIPEGMVVGTLAYMLEGMEAGKAGSMAQDMPERNIVFFRMGYRSTNWRIQSITWL